MNPPRIERIERIGWHTVLLVGNFTKSDDLHGHMPALITIIVIRPQGHHKAPGPMRSMRSMRWDLFSVIACAGILGETLEGWDWLVVYFPLGCAGKNWTWTRDRDRDHNLAKTREKIQGAWLCDEHRLNNINWTVLIMQLIFALPSWPTIIMIMIVSFNGWRDPGGVGSHCLKQKLIMTQTLTDMRCPEARAPDCGRWTCAHHA